MRKLLLISILAIFSSSAFASSNYSCNSKTCKKMSSCAEAVYQLKQCGKKRLDRDHDGIPCESLCGSNGENMPKEKSKSSKKKGKKK
ncbi:Excalibur calcium-binding domain [Phocoenobacter uteri]|uniref:Excalibur calcium-binding domain n=1 Tax=Phocoenobacter uteri TaxID=146806 RepID=A0A379CAC4_9PAST|nr:excalibur calcium-binding domain-containing protein [Phocoenobacter uteri]MDG6881067.1 hypothetical protein [Phocoenobacter uteri]SUB59088.1 Excalibur calcium-binding domain [Phocoenobacter uteri]